MFRKIICLIVVVFTLLSVFTASASAVITYESGVMADLSTLKVDGVPFSKEGYPVKKEDDNMYVLAVVEQGFSSSSSSPNFDFYIYLYNPSCVNVVDDPFNAVQANCIDDCKTEKYTYYGLKLIDKSDDSRFLKLRVYQNGLYKTPVENLYKSQKNDHERIYHIVSVRLFAGNEDKTFALDKSFVFSGFDYNNSLSCYSEELGSIQVEMHPTNWISPNAGYKEDGVTEAGIYDHYEINSVYFTLPRSLFEGPDAYDDLVYIGAAFDWYRLTPIIVTAPSHFSSDKGQVTKSAILNGTKIPVDGEIDVFEISAAKDDWLWGNYIDVDWVYSENYKFISRWVMKDADYYDCLAYYFENSQLEGYDFVKAKSGEVVGFTSEQLEAYFYERYNDPNYDRSKLYTDYDHEEIDFWAREYNADSLYKMQAYSSVVHDDRAWYKKIGKSNDSYLFEDFKLNADHLQVIQDPSDYVSVTDPKAVANELFISQYDVAHFSKLCQKAVDNNEVVVLLRFGFSDYTCAPIVDCWEAFDVFTKYIGVAIEKTAYFDVNLLHAAFAKNKEIIVVPVVSNTVDSAGDGLIMGGTNESPADTFFGGGKDDNDPDIWKKIVMIVGIVLLVVALFYLIKLLSSKNGAGDVKLALNMLGEGQKTKSIPKSPPKEKKPKRKWFRR